MKYCIKLFGPLNRAADSGHLAISMDDSAATCGAVRERIAACEPRLAGLLDACRFAVNGQFAAEDQIVKEADEIALIGFVSGG